MIDYLKSLSNPDNPGESPHKVNNGDFIAITLKSRNDLIRGSYVDHNDKYLTMGPYSDEKERQDPKYKEMMSTLAEQDSGYIPDTTTYEWENIESLTKYRKYAKKET